MNELRAQVIQERLIDVGIQNTESVKLYLQFNYIFPNNMLSWFSQRSYYVVYRSTYGCNPS
jgi:hypothetical protein